MTKPSGILDPAFVYIPARDHDADSTKFRERQRARIAAAEKARAQQANVRPITQRKAK